jgi:hypothetical protein
MEEVWKPIKGYEGLYEISNLGRIKSLPKPNYKSKIKILKPPLNTYGYCYVTFFKDKHKYNYLIHRLVLQAFIGYSDMQCNHKNGIKTDNRLENLEYCTQSENMIHAYQIGLQIPLKGELSKNSKLSLSDVINIRKLYQKRGYWNQLRLSKLFNVSRPNISNIVNNKRWEQV